MAFPDEPRGGETPSGEPAPPPQESTEAAVSGEVLTDTPVTQGGESYTYDDGGSSATQPETAIMVTPPVAAPRPEPPRSKAAGGGSGKPPKPPEPPEEDEEEEGMARMSFLEHLEELRKRILLALSGIGIAFVLSLTFSQQLWKMVSGPGINALKHLGVNPPTLKLINPMDTFQIIWLKLPLLAAIFIGSPWILYQVWAFIAPGLYKKERRWAAPFVLSSAGLFIAGGFFAYFVVFRFGLEFLLGLGIGQGVDPAVNVNEYYSLFVEVMLGVGVVFEIPILIFLLTLVHIVSPKFLIQHSRYAIMAIVILAAVVTPTGDVFNLTLFATPMIVLFYVGIFASYILVLHREKRRFPWNTFFKWLGLVLLAVLLIAFAVARYYGYHIVAHWPVFVR